MAQRIPQNTHEEAPVRSYDQNLDETSYESGTPFSPTTSTRKRSSALDGLGLSLRAMFKEKSFREGQLTEANVLLEAINIWVEASKLGQVDKPIDVYLMEFLETRRRNHENQIAGTEQDINATKKALKGSRY